MTKGWKSAILAVLVLAGCGRAPGTTLGTAPAIGQGPRPSGYTPYVAAPAGGGVIDMAIGGGTYGRLARATGDIQTCEAVLSQARVTFSPTPDRVNSATCGLRAAGVLGPDLGTRARLAPNAPTMTCALAVALSVWRRQSLEPAAREILGAEVVEIDHMGVYACRAINTNSGNTNSGNISSGNTSSGNTSLGTAQTANRPSAHSRAAAIDFAGVVLSDGRRITVSADWTDPGPKGRFLHRIRDDACKVFGTTLSPDYNALHHDHLHLEAEPARFCR